MASDKAMQRIEKAIKDGYRRGAPGWAIRAQAPKYGNAPYDFDSLTDEWYEAQEEARLWLQKNG
jgi:hypothetical protein